MRKDIMISGICALSLIMLTQNAYAQTYEKESESGKVRFQCELEVPENWNGKEIPKFILESVHFVDSEKTYANFVEGKEILEHYNTPARACLKKAFCKMCVTICGIFCPDEGAVAGYGN